MIIGMVTNDMNILNIHDFPDDLYERLLQVAHARNQSLSALIVDMLSRTVDDKERRSDQANILKAIQNRRFKKTANTPSTLDLLREDRGR